MAFWNAKDVPWFAVLYMIPFQLIGLGFLTGTLMMLFGHGELRFRDGALEMFSGKITNEYFHAFFRFTIQECS